MCFLWSFFCASSENFAYWFLYILRNIAFAQQHNSKIIVRCIAINHQFHKRCAAVNSKALHVFPPWQDMYSKYSEIEMSETNHRYGWHVSTDMCGTTVVCRYLAVYYHAWRHILHRLEIIRLTLEHWIISMPWWTFRYEIIKFTLGTDGWGISCEIHPR